MRSFFPGTGATVFMSSTLLEEAFKVIPSQQLLVNVVSKRVRQLTAGHRPMVETGPRMGFSDIALKEIIEGKHDSIPESCFYMVGGLDEALENAKKQ